MQGRDRLLTLKQVAARLKVAEKTVERMVAEGTFPAGFHVGRKGAAKLSRRWYERDVEAYHWLQARLGTPRPPSDEKSG
jgi:excisionase family DNA binding protein